MADNVTDAMISLSAAATTAYQQIFAIRKHRNKTPSVDELDLVALALSTHLPIYGVPDSGHEPVRIAEPELMQGMFRGGATRFELRHGDTTLTQLRVRQNDLEAVLELLRHPPSRATFADGLKPESET